MEEQEAISVLKTQPQSKVIRSGYINVYSSLSPQEERGLNYKIKYKELNPDWDESLVILGKKFEEILRENGGEVEKVLDAGCGHGNYIIDEFRRNIGWAVGVDLAPEFTAKNICLDEIRYLDLAALPLADNSFDVCLSLWALEHLPDPQAVLREIYRVIKPGGYFLLATPNRRSWLIRARAWLNGGLARKWVGLVYGRQAGDVFPVYYRANEEKFLTRLLKEIGFGEVKLIPNFDPSYTSFGELTFRSSNLADRVFSSLGLQLTKSHLVGWARKL